MGSRLSVINEQFVLILLDFGLPLEVVENLFFFFKERNFNTIRRYLLIIKQINLEVDTQYLQLVS